MAAAPPAVVESLAAFGPSVLLRARYEAARHEMMATLVADLREAAVLERSRALARLLARDGPLLPDAPDEPAAAARAARLVHVSPVRAGITRLGGPGRFTYRGPGGRTLRDPRALERIAALAIPPAWTEVWISPDPRTHVQAVGRDARGRKQYRYHPRWDLVRESAKFGSMIELARALPRIRRVVTRDLARPGLGREKVLAALVRLLDTTAIRVGSDEYARANHHYGLTTLTNRHARVRGAEIRFRFVGKSGKERRVTVEDARLARLVKVCAALPGERLFQWRDEDGRVHPVESADVNEYLARASGAHFTAKDFRTWLGTTFVAASLAACEAPTSVTAARAHVLAAIDAAAERLGNTRAVCRRSYVHPSVIEAFVGGWDRASGSRRRPRGPGGLAPIERATLALLERAAALTRGERRRARVLDPGMAVALPGEPSRTRRPDHPANAETTMAKYGKKAQDSVKRAMHEAKRGELKSGKSGKKVTNPKQAIAIGLSEARKKGAKMPPAPKRSGKSKSSASSRAKRR